MTTEAIVVEKYVLEEKDRKIAELEAALERLYEIVRQYKVAVDKASDIIKERDQLRDLVHEMRDLIAAGDFNKLLKPDSEIMKKADQLLGDKE